MNSGERILAADKIKKERTEEEEEESAFLIKKTSVINAKTKHIESLVQHLEKTSGFISSNAEIASSGSGSKTVHTNGVKAQPKLLPRPQSPKSASSTNISNNKSHSTENSSKTGMF